MFQASVYAHGAIVTDTTGNTCMCHSGTLTNCKCIEVGGSTFTPVGQIQVGDTHACRCTEAARTSLEASLTHLQNCFPLTTHMPLLRKTFSLQNRDFSHTFNISDHTNQVTDGSNFLPAVWFGMTAVWSTAPACSFTSSPHHHPRATEYLLAGPGTTLVVTIAEQHVDAQSDKQELYTSKIVGPALTAVPQGLVHYVFNPTCNDTKLYVVLNNADAGRVGMNVPQHCRKTVNVGSPPTRDVVSSLIYSACTHRNECNTRCGFA